MNAERVPRLLRGNGRSTTTNTRHQVDRIIKIKIYRLAARLADSHGKYTRATLRGTTTAVVWRCRVRARRDHEGIY